MRSTSRPTARTRYVQAYAGRQSPFERTTLLRGLVQCLSAREIALLLLSHFGAASDLKEALLRRAVADSHVNISHDYLSVVVRLIDVALVNAGEVSRKAGYCIARFAPVLPARLRRRAIVCLLRSRYVINRRRGYALVAAQRVAAYLCEIEASWKKTRDPEAARVIVRHSSLSFLRAHVGALRESLPWRADVSRLVIRLAPSAPQLLVQLRASDGISYAYVCTKLRKRLALKTADQLFEEFLADERLGLLIWCFGQQKLWPVLARLARSSEVLLQRQNEQRERSFRRNLPPSLSSTLTIA